MTRPTRCSRGGRTVSRAILQRPETEGQAVVRPGLRLRCDWYAVTGNAGPVTGSRGVANLAAPGTGKSGADVRAAIVTGGGERGATEPTAPVAVSWRG